VEWRYSGQSLDGPWHVTCNITSKALLASQREAALVASSVNDLSQCRSHKPEAWPDAERSGGPAWSFEIGDGPVVASAIHSGHEVRPDVAEWMEVSDSERLREEDPLTGFWTSVGDSSIQVYRSRFEMDLNRPRDKAIVMDPCDCWGLNVWRERPPRRVIEQSLAQYDRFYQEVAALLDGLLERWNSILVLDLHSYNYRRGGPGTAGDSAVGNPEINVGTGTMDRDLWATLVDTFVAALRRQPFRTRTLDVRENVKFMGGHFPHWLHTRYPKHVCVLSLEFKKFFMDEWSATANIHALEDLRIALRNATSATRPALTRQRGPAR
jgi:N-formylglutamate deformylase